MILDMTCGAKSTWFNKHPKDTVFLDKRVERLTLCDDREIEVKPDVQADFVTSPLPITLSTWCFLILRT